MLLLDRRIRRGTVFGVIRGPQQSTDYLLPRTGTELFTYSPPNTTDGELYTACSVVTGAGVKPRFNHLGLEIKITVVGPFRYNRGG